MPSTSPTTACSPKRRAHRFTRASSGRPATPRSLAILEAVSHSVVLVQIAQFALLAITALAVYAIGRRVADERTGLVAGLLCASYLPLVWYATYHLTEITACLCVTATVLAVLWARTGPTWAWAAVGLSLAAATYVRPGFLFAPLLIAAATLIENRKGWQAPAVTLAVFALAVAPWTARNHHLTGRVIPMPQPPAQACSSPQSSPGATSPTRSPSTTGTVSSPGRAAPHGSTRADSPRSSSSPQTTLSATEPAAPSTNSPRPTSRAASPNASPTSGAQPTPHRTDGTAPWRTAPAKGSTPSW